MALNIGINGFGRIGRTLFRLLDSRDDINVVAINDVAPADKLTYLLKYDTVMGRFPVPVELKGDTLHTSSQQARLFAQPDPSKLPWKECGAEVVVEATGRFRTRAECKMHIDAGAKHVLLSVPAKDEIDMTVVLGVNQDQLKSSHQIISNASCTTNCLAPVVKILNDAFGIEWGFMTTVHAYTNDQRLSDYAHKDLRRARAANDNIIPTTTGAAKAVGHVLPELAGKLDGMAMRVPVPNGSTIDLVAILKRNATREQVNSAMQAAAESEFKGLVEYATDPIVSSDIMQNPHSAIFDSLSTMVMDNNFVKLFAWYDNEWGYSCRLVDVLEIMSGWN
jgi:glyceraldehyde 3-phosphate dehydrogenase